ncbi:MAG TPA: nucleotide exchange factor GrpE [Gammaproteobacteria bacterium]|jgi:molecular chaperone GrpE|nr:nucleotide exchange factor GrpE [Gammaproteobacteria bacterium]
MNEEQTDTAGSGGADPALEALRREAEDNRDRYLRTAAELENLRKRSAREVDMARKFGAEKLAQAILPVRDSLEAGLIAAEKAGLGPQFEGVRATLRLLDDAFGGAGIREIDPKGQPFDPNKHEALSLLPAAAVAPNTVLEVVQKGYELNERLLRAAKVVVSRAADA